MFRFRCLMMLFILLAISKSNAQTTSIPDSNFEQALIDLGIDSDGTVNGRVLTSDVIPVPDLDVSGREISDLRGIEDFVNLTELYCDNNLLTSLSLSSNVKLRTLNCSRNSLSSLNLKDLVELKVFRCSLNEITELNLSYNTLLEEFYCDSNLLTTLNLKDNLELLRFNCSENRLNSLNITFNWKLEYLDFSSNLIEYTDLSNNVRLEYLDCSRNPLTSIFLNNLLPLKTVYIVDNDKLTSIDFSHNHELEHITCRENDALTRINLSATLALKYLDCSNNSLTELQTLYNPLLENIYCQNNKIKDLDLSQNENLAYLQCGNNQLETLDLKNGSNGLMTGGMTYFEGNYMYLEGLDARNNPLLLCIQVDDEEMANMALSPYDSWLTDNNAVFSENCESNLAADDYMLEKSIRLYPNPVEGILVIVSEYQPIEKIELFNVVGLKIRQLEYGFDQVNIQDIPPGIYLLRIQTERGFVARRILKE